jgi:hypothetical protein
MFTAVGRFPRKSGECSRQFADFRGNPANVHGSWSISAEVPRMFTAVRRFLRQSGECSRQFANFRGSPVDVTAVRRFSRQSGGLLGKPAAFFVNRQLFVPDV